MALAFSAEEPDSLRGPQFGAAWSDEVAKWRYAEAAYDMIQFGLRLGEHPRSLVTTTPRPTALIRRLLGDPAVVVSRSRTADNAANLAPAFLDAVVGRYAGTRLGRQELDGELIEDRADALWSRAGDRGRPCDRGHRRRWRASSWRSIRRPRRGPGADACGIVAAGLSGSGHAYVLADATLEPGHAPGLGAGGPGPLPPPGGRRPRGRGQPGRRDGRRRHPRDRPDRAGDVPVRATRGKYLRAEPVSLLYAQGRVHHVGALPALEDELCDFIFCPLSA